MTNDASSIDPDPADLPDTARSHADKCIYELEQYFDGRLQHFSIPLDLRGTPFQLRVWDILMNIPFGATRSYAWIAQRLGGAGGSRAVGAANGANPIPIIVPCHRVISSDGSMGGYNGGLDRKRWLLNHEIGAAGTLFADTASEATT